MPRRTIPELYGLVHRRPKRLRRKGPKPDHTIERILQWADSHHQRTGKWPTDKSGRVQGTLDETWGAISMALRSGSRGLPGGSSLSGLLWEHRGVRRSEHLPLTIEQILERVDAHHERTGKWPKVTSGHVVEAPKESWRGIDGLLRYGGRGLRGGSSLAQFLEEHRGVPNPRNLPRLTERHILRWALAHRKRTGRWPSRTAGAVTGTAENWQAIDSALKGGSRGAPRNSSLAKLFQRHFGRRHPRDLPPLSIQKILKWADDFHQRTGRWPTQTSGPITESPEETWCAIDRALAKGSRGLPGDSSLVKLLVENGRRRYRTQQPAFELDRIVEWAKAYHKRQGRWPTESSGPIDEAPGETWSKLVAAFRSGVRGLAKGLSLSQLLRQRLGVQNARAVATVDRIAPDTFVWPSKVNRPPLSANEILRWADVHYQRTGQWPNTKSGRIEGSGGESWRIIDRALRRGTRGLSRRTSLARVLRENRVFPSRLLKSRLTEEQILAWADEHHRRTGRWPTQHAGAIVECPKENWRSIDNGLRLGLRGLPGGLSLAHLLEERRGKRNHLTRPKLTIGQILSWADEHRRRTGQWPRHKSGQIGEAIEETWQAVEQALRKGSRGLAGGSSLARLLQQRRGRRPTRSMARLSVRVILEWADAFHQRTGRWPKRDDGVVQGSNGQTWKAINGALSQGRRGLPGGSSLGKLLWKHRGVRSHLHQPRLTEAQVLRWLVDHRKRTGRWPTIKSGPVAGTSQPEKWAAVEAALRLGLRGLPGGSSIAKLLSTHCGHRNKKALPQLTEEKIVAWAKAYRKRNGDWPQVGSGAVPEAEAPKETWRAIDQALNTGTRGLAGGSSLLRLLPSRVRAT